MTLCAPMVVLVSFAAGAAIVVAARYRSLWIKAAGAGAVKRISNALADSHNRHSFDNTRWMQRDAVYRTRITRYCDWLARIAHADGTAQRLRDMAALALRECDPNTTHPTTK